MKKYADIEFDRNIIDRFIPHFDKGQIIYLVEDLNSLLTGVRKQWDIKHEANKFFDDRSQNQIQCYFLPLFIKEVIDPNLYKKETLIKLENKIKDLYKTTAFILGFTGDFSRTLVAYGQDKISLISSLVSRLRFNFAITYLEKVEIDLDFCDLPTIDQFLDELYENKLESIGE